MLSVICFLHLSSTLWFFFALPIFSEKQVSPFLRLILILFLTALLGITLYPHYFERKEGIFSTPLQESSSAFFWFFISIFLQEFFTGYLFSLCFSFLREAALLAGEFCSQAMAFSSAQMIDPQTGVSHPLLSQFFSLTFLTFFLSFDFHYLLFFFLRDFFLSLPLGTLSLSKEAIQAVVQMSGLIYHHAIRLALLPYISLFLVTMALGIMAKAVPEMNIFVLGFPIKIFVGLCVLMASTKFFPLLVKFISLHFKQQINFLLIYF